MSDTPRTDSLKLPSEVLLPASEKHLGYSVRDAIQIIGDHARQLERELIAAEKRQHQSDLNYDALERVNVKLTASQKIVDIALECFGERGIRPYAIEQLERAVISWKLNQDDPQK